MAPTTIQLLAAAFFAMAIIHTFTVSKIEQLAHYFPKNSIRGSFFHLIGEVEIVFGLWAAAFVAIYCYFDGIAIYDEHHHVIGGAIHFLEQQNFTEPTFVFVIMCMAGTKPIVYFSEKVIAYCSKLLPFSEKMRFYVTALIMGPILGSFITEPAAMTVTAMILLKNYYNKNMSELFMYATLGLLFVNISVGGTLTNFAAPPVLMVAFKWNWSISHMFAHFGYKSVIAIIFATTIISFLFKKELTGKLDLEKVKDEIKIPFWVVLVHLLFLGVIVYMAHHTVISLAIFLFFIGFTTVTQKYQSKLKIKESLLVGFFLAGLVTLGSMQDWWLKEVLSKLGDLTLYFGSTGLTAITDNAALTYLGSLVELTDSAKYNLVAGAVTGGGLTVIANAPNPAGYSLLKGSFGEKGIGPLKLFLAALPPTVIVIIFFQILPSL